MTESTVTEDQWSQIAAELHLIADDVLKLVGEPAPGTFQLNIQPRNADGYQKNTVKNRPLTVAAVDAVANALLGKDSTDRRMADGTFHRDASGNRGPVVVQIYTSVADPDAVDPEMEIARLRAENEQLRAAVGQDYSRPVAPEDAPPATSRRIPPHLEDGRTGQVAEETRGTPTDGGPRARQAGHLAMHTAAAPKVPATDPGDVPQVQMAASGLTIEADQSRGPLAGTTPVVTYFSFGHGQTDPDTSKQLLGHYVTVVAPTYEACREAMFASRFGRAWSFDYLAGTDRATAWIPEWTEHEVIVAPGTEPAGAESALKAARDVLDGVVPF